ncbi:MAG: YlbF family regulator [Christensenellales bacterium]|nr:YlbF family regulator [Christensenellales bacterium]
MDLILEKTRELGDALLESECYQKLKAAENKAMQNAEAAQMMSDVLERRSKLQELIQQENPDPVAMKRLSDEMDEIQEKLQMMDDIVELSQARSDFNALIGQINQVLQFIVTGRMDDSGCSGDCSGCSGCH